MNSCIIVLIYASFWLSMPGYTPIHNSLFITISVFTRAPGAQVLHICVRRLFEKISPKEHPCGDLVILQVSTISSRIRCAPSRTIMGNPNQQGSACSATRGRIKYFQFENRKSAFDISSIPRGFFQECSHAILINLQNTKSSRRLCSGKSANSARFLMKPDYLFYIHIGYAVTVG